MDSVNQVNQVKSNDQRQFVNIFAPDNLGYPNDLIESDSLGMLVGQKWEATGHENKAFGYLQTSPSWKSGHQEYLDNNFFKELNLGIDPYGLGLWQSHLFKSHLSKKQFEKALDKKTRIFRISTLPYKISGSSNVQDLAILLSSTLQFFRDYEGEVEVSDLFKCLSYEICLGSHLFESLNQIKAFKILMARLMELYEVDQMWMPPIYTIANVRELSCREPWNNILRLTSVHSASLMSGVQGHVSLPYDLFSKQKGGRVARNITEILKRESHLDKVLNPVDGSFYSEQKTQELCEKAWSLCGEIENKEGLKSSLRSGWLYTQIYEYQDEETKKFLLREKKMTGVNQFVLKHSLSKKYPLVDSTSRLSLEEWWANWMDLSQGEKLCQVERFVPHSLVDTFEKWQFKGDNWNKKRGEGNEIPVLIESSQVKNKKWSPINEVFGLAGLSLREISIAEIEEAPLILILASDPEGEFVKALFKNTPENMHDHFIWGGEKLVEPFSFCLNQHQCLDEFFQFVFRRLEASL